MKYVYLVQHVQTIFEHEEEVKILGVYTDEKLAARAIEKARMLKGFSESPERFHVDKYELNKDHWTKGFVMNYS